jgi:hypothetical protein
VRVSLSLSRRIGRSGRHDAAANAASATAQAEMLLLAETRVKRTQRATREVEAAMAWRTSRGVEAAMADFMGLVRLPLV